MSKQLIIAFNSTEDTKLAFLTSEEVQNAFLYTQTVTVVRQEGDTIGAHCTNVYSVLDNLSFLASEIVDKEERRSQKDAVDKLFQKYLYRIYGVETNPKADKVFRKAWEYGHASGYEEVECYFSDLVELIKDEN